jgi:hypothetical protein
MAGIALRKRSKFQAHRFFMKELFAALQSIGNLPDSEIKRFIDLAKRRKIANGSYFIQ